MRNTTITDEITDNKYSSSKETSMINERIHQKPLQQPCLSSSSSSTVPTSTSSFERLPTKFHTHNVSILMKKVLVRISIFRPTYHLGISFFILWLPLLFCSHSNNNNKNRSCHAYSGIGRITTTRRLMHHVSLLPVSMGTTTATSVTEATSTNEGCTPTVASKCNGHCLDHRDELNHDNTNDMVIRNVHQSTIDPIIWQQYMVPTMSWWETLVESRITNINNEKNPYSTDISMRWNFTLDDANITTTAERFLELLDATVSMSKHRSPPWSVIPTIATNIPQTPFRQAMVQNIASAMKEFSTYCDSHHHHAKSNNEAHQTLSFTMRMLCTYGGRRAGTKCPIWHIDHVPCRYIQTFYGPTCMFINNHRDNRIIYHRIIAQHMSQATLDDNDSNDEFLSVEERNEILLQGIDDKSCIGHASVGEGIILLGNAWTQWTMSDDDDNDKHTAALPAAAVHKSPHITSPNQGRILFTINVNE
jgi:Protein of unknown function (DUF1826)